MRVAARSLPITTGDHTYQVSARMAAVIAILLQHQTLIDEMDFGGLEFYLAPMHITWKLSRNFEKVQLVE